MCIFIGYPKGKKVSSSMTCLPKSSFESRDVVLDEERFHEFNSGEQSSKPNSEQLPFDPFTVQDVADNAKPNDGNDQQDPAENNVPEPAHHHQPVGETYEETFMRNVENLNPQRRRRPPARYDEELYNVEDLTADVSEPRSIKQAWSGDHCIQWKEATDPCLYLKSVKQQNAQIDFVILCLHVDDILLF